MSIVFYNPKEVPLRQIAQATVICRRQQASPQWIFTRPHGREEWEIPFAPRLEGEQIRNTALRVIFENVGAFDYKLYPMYAYRADPAGDYALLFFADIFSRELFPSMQHSLVFSDVPAAYNTLSAALLEKAEKWLADHPAIA